MNILAPAQSRFPYRPSQSQLQPKGNGHASCVFFPSLLRSLHGASVFNYEPRTLSGTRRSNSSAPNMTYSPSIGLGSCITRGLPGTPALVETVPAQRQKLPRSRYKCSYPIGKPLTKKEKYTQHSADPSPRSRIEVSIFESWHLRLKIGMKNGCHTLKNY